MHVYFTGVNIFYRYINYSPKLTTHITRFNEMSSHVCALFAAPPVPYITLISNKTAPSFAGLKLSKQGTRTKSTAASSVRNRLSCWVLLAVSVIVIGLGSTVWVRRRRRIGTEGVQVRPPPGSGRVRGVFWSRARFGAPVHSSPVAHYKCNKSLDKLQF